MALLGSADVGMPHDEQWEGRSVCAGLWTPPQPTSMAEARGALSAFDLPAAASAP